MSHGTDATDNPKEIPIMAEQPAIAIQTITHPWEQHEPSPMTQTVGCPSGNGVLVTTREGYTVTRFDGPKESIESHSFDDIESLARWLIRYGKPESAQVLFDQDEIVASLEPRTVNSRRVRCKLVPHPSFAAWLDATGRPLSQADFLELLRGHGAAFSQPNSAESLAGELLKIEVASGHKLNSEIDATGLQKFHGSDTKKEVSGKIPPSFKLYVPVVDGVRTADDAEAAYMVDVLVTLSIKENRPQFKLSIPSLPLILRKSRRDAADFLERLLGDGFEVLLGKYSSEVRPSYEDPNLLGSG